MAFLRVLLWEVKRKSKTDLWLFFIIFYATVALPNSSLQGKNEWEREREQEE